MSPVDTSLRSVLADTFEVPEAQIVPGASLRSLGLDSLSLAELALILQERLGVEVEEHEAAEDTTVGELSEALAARRGASAAAANH